MITNQGTCQPSHVSKIYFYIKYLMVIFMHPITWGDRSRSCLPVGDRGVSLPDDRHIDNMAGTGAVKCQTS